MSRISRAAWLAMAAAMVASLLSVGALVRVAAQPRLATPLAAEAPLLSLVTGDGVVVVHANGAYRIKSNLRIAPIAWSEYGRILAVRSVGHLADGIGLIVSIERGGLPELETLVIDGDRMRPLLPAQLPVA